MSNWTYRILMTILAIVFISQLVVIVLTKPKPVACINGVIMEQHEDMWVQRGIFATQCMAIDKD